MRPPRLSVWNVLGGKLALGLGLALLFVAAFSAYVDVLAWRRVEHPLPGVDGAEPSAVLGIVVVVVFGALGVLYLWRWSVTKTGSAGHVADEPDGYHE